VHKINFVLFEFCQLLCNLKRFKVSCILGKKFWNPWPSRSVFHPISFAGCFSSLSRAPHLWVPFHLAEPLSVRRLEAGERLDVKVWPDQFHGLDLVFGWQRYSVPLCAPCEHSPNLTILQIPPAVGARFNRRWGNQDMLKKTQEKRNSRQRERKTHRQRRTRRKDRTFPPTNTAQKGNQKYIKYTDAL